MVDDILDHVIFIVTVFVVGTILIIIGLTVQSTPLVVLGSVFDELFPF